MPTTNFKKGIDIAITELMAQLPTATTALSCMTTAEEGDDPYLYYLVSNLFYRYDTRYDSWIQLASPYVAPVTVSDMRYTMRRGHHGTILGATSTTVRIGGRRGPLFNGKTIRTLTNTGAGQERVLTYVKDNIHDFGTNTGGTGTSNIVDSLKKWKINQWKGYTVGIVSGQGVTEYKTILYNDTNTLYFYDVNLQPHDPWNNYPFALNAPYNVVTASAPTQAHYQIMSQDYTVDAWTVTPDTTTTFTTLTGGIWLFSSAAATPFMTLQYYDCIADRWQVKTVQQGLLDVALGTDCGLERTGKFGTAFETGTLTSASGRQITDTSKTLTVDRYTNHRVLITGGTGAGQNRRITCNTDDSFWINRAWDIVPDNTSTYEIWADFDKLYANIGARSTLLAYSPENDYWMQGQNIDDGVCSILSAKKGWDMPFAISTGTRLAAGILAINPTPTAAGLNYVLGDILTCAVGGAGGQMIVTGITTGGAVTSLELFSAGTSGTYTTGTGKATTGGTGTGCTIEITSVGPTVRVTTAINHQYKTGDVITIAGNTDSAHNGSKTILCVSGLTTFDIATSAAANMATTLAQTTTIIVDSTKNWIVNELAGKLIDLNVAGTAPTSQKRWIVSNTANTITVQGSITAGVSGTSKYCIYEPKVFGIDYQYKQPEKDSVGHASGGSTTTLVDSSKDWNINQWAGYKMHIKAGTGFGSGIITITSNTPTTLTYTTQTFTPDDTTCYEIHDTWGLCTAATASVLTEASTKNWIVNQWSGKRTKILAGTGTTGAETIIQTNTATALTVVTNGLTAGDTSTVYAICGLPIRGAASKLLWLWGLSDTTKKGRYMIVPRGGGSNTFDLFDIVTGRAIYGWFFSPQQDAYTTGSQYAYSGGDLVYAQKDATGRINAYNFITNSLEGAMTINDVNAFLTGTAVVGNRMEIVEIEGIKFLYLAQPTGTKMWRVQII